MKALRAWAVWLTLSVWTMAAYGDGGTLLLHQDAGPFTVSLFAASQPLTTGMADLSVMVQDQRTGDVLLDPVIDLTAKQEASETGQPPIRLTRRDAGNRLLQAAGVPFPHPGKWRLTLRVHRANQQAQLQTEVMVQPGSSRTALIWFYLLLPIGVILLFLLHQALKRSQQNRPAPRL